MAEGQNEAPRHAPAEAQQSVTVHIYDCAYHLRGTDPRHIQEIAELVDAKMRAVAQHGTTVDSLRVAVLAALNIADEMLTAKRRYEALASKLSQEQTTLRSRTDNMAGLLDSVLESNRRAG